MGFWDRVRKDLQHAMKEGVDLLKEGTSTLRTEARRVAEKGAATMTTEARRMTQLGKLRYRISRLNQKAASNFSEIGGRVYDLASEDLKAFKFDEKLEKLVMDTKAIESEIKKLEGEVRKLSKKKEKSAA